ncbi:hypothetical protein H5119_17435 [Pseudoalteromonas sp. SG45-5]|uniref:DEAD/DEAH box helicase n=1 Tax=unclassified Pseudoalteromonas TaxID=194690 RepID=UPI0015F866C4|nr:MULTISPECIES: AAA domain-containing protein [unclassified Pseudoalteromonas]MBB1387292.1 hypothetical protein [Pseudoalteromonas sp. SG45-5]MBB1395409.1 hypothetical protein [Pseudoalteromonas sp. SG44-4]
MIGIFKSALHALFGRKKAFIDFTPSSSTLTTQLSSSSAKKINNFKVRHKEPKATPEVDNAIINENKNKDRCQRILNYWLDAELFDLPECPVDYKKNLISEPADKFKTSWIEQAEDKFKDGKLEITENSRLMIMFQCHRAGYIAKDDEKHPNYNTPRTYLVGQALIPRWDEDRQIIVWSRSEEVEDLIINLATIRTLYRRCNSSIPDSMSLSEWVEARMENIETVLHSGFLPEDENTPLTSTELSKRILLLNRELAGQFWPDELSRQFMIEQCQPIDSSYDSNSDIPEVGKKSGAVTFRWRFCYYPDGLESKQLGPFFVDDLERSISAVSKWGTKGLSLPLRSYLLGRKDKTEVPEAVNQGDFFWPLTNGIIYGRWPENPEFGLSLLQSFAVNTAKKAGDNPVVAVNGPPGTGKTTLLKDIIADKLVSRTLLLKELSDKDDWFSDEEVTRLIMQHSMVVASSNNKAVENISKELPSLSKLYKAFSSKTKHFKNVAPEGDWGVFCAVLGNSKNRKAFKPLLKALSAHLNKVSDFFHLDSLMKDLKKKGKESAKEVIANFVQSLQEQEKLMLLASDIKKCHANNKYNKFFLPFTDALISIEQSELSIDTFSTNWAKFTNEQWLAVIEALDSFKKQWFGKKLHQDHSERKFKTAKSDFENAFAKIKKLADRSSKEWVFDHDRHLIGTKAYSKRSDEPFEEAEKRLQQQSPLGSEELNRCRSELFIYAMALNEAILEQGASQFKKHWGNLGQLIDGRLETKEAIPEHQQLWSLLFLFFPVISTSLSSVENQFKLMQKTGGFGLSMIDEAGQAVNYHVAGLLQRSRQTIFVGDPIQLEPVVTMPPSIDLAIAADFLPISKKDTARQWGDDYMVSASSAQSLGDNAGQYIAKIGERKVGIPLLVHRRCNEPMFSVANKIAYDNRMVLASQPFKWKAIQSGWINVSEKPDEINKQGYANQKEAKVALDVIQFLVEEQPEMVAGGVYIITPFSNMSAVLKKEWKSRSNESGNHSWMQEALGESKQEQSLATFSEDNIGTVHTFQGKEASTVIICTAASKVRNKAGGITWVNGKPNLLNVAVTRAKHHLFVIGDINDWSTDTLSSELQQGGMNCYDSFDHFTEKESVLYGDYEENRVMTKQASTEVEFNFG